MQMSFSQIEALLGFLINHAFLNYKNELCAYGWLCHKISLKEKHSTFFRLPEHSTVFEKDSFTVIGKEGKLCGIWGALMLENHLMDAANLYLSGS